MEVVFDAKALAAAKRWQGWRDAICEIYLKVDCDVAQARDYVGLVREAQFGAVTLTDSVISPQTVRRRDPHIARSVKDCYYLGIERVSAVNIRQANSSLVIRPGVGAIYYANRPYELQCNAVSRQFWVELPRKAFDARFRAGRPPVLAELSLGRGLGRIAADFCETLAAEGADVDDVSRAQLGEQLMDVLAMALSAAPEQQTIEGGTVRAARLRAIKAYIEARLGDPGLTPALIARQNGMSLRSLHQLFKDAQMSVSEWVRFRRLQRCCDLLSSSRHAQETITDIAYSMGFSSSSHFSNLFRAQFNMRPSDVRPAAGSRAAEDFLPTDAAKARREAV